MTRTLSASDCIRLEDGRTMTVEQAVACGVAEVRRAWTVWQNMTHGNILGLAPQWRKDTMQLCMEEPSAVLREVYGTGFEFREIRLLATPDGSQVWSEVSRRTANHLAAIAARSA